MGTRFCGFKSTTKAGKEPKQRESWAPAGRYLDPGALLSSQTHLDPGVAPPAEGEAHLEPHTDTAGGPSRRAVELILCAWHQVCRAQLCRVPADRQGRQVWLYRGTEVLAFMTPRTALPVTKGLCQQYLKHLLGVSMENTVTHLLFHLPGTAPTPPLPL